MKRIVALAVALLLIAGSALAWIECESRGGGINCSSSPSVSWTNATADQTISNNGAYTYFGNRYDGSSSFNVCKVSVNMKVGGGTLTSKTYRVSVYALDGSNNFLNYPSMTPKGSSEDVSGSSIGASYSYVDFTFTAPVTVSSGNVIVVYETSLATDANNFATIGRTGGTGESSEWVAGLWRNSVNGALYTMNGSGQETGIKVYVTQ